MLLEHRSVLDDRMPTWFRRRAIPAWADATARHHVVELAGELDIAAGGLLHEAFDRREILGAGRVVVDCRSVTFCDSRGLEALVRHGRRIERSGATFAVVPSPAVERVVELARHRVPVTSPPAVFADTVLVCRIHLGGHGAGLAK